MSDLIHLEYSHPADDVAAAVTPTLASGTAATGYGPERTGNTDPSYPFKVDETTFRLVWDFTTPIALQFVLLVHHNFQAALSGVLFEMNDTNVWTSPSFSHAITIPPYHEDRFPENAKLDLRPFGSPSYRYGSLAVTSANVVPCAIGEIVLATQLRAISGTFQLDAEEDESHPLQENKTDVGVSSIYVHGTRWRYVRGQVIQTATTAVQIRSWNRACFGRGYPCVVWPHLDDDDEPMYMRFEKDGLPRTRIAPDGISRYQLGFEELSRGLRPTPAAV
jgi:hypothetical protein